MFSFTPTKNITTGEGGMITTNDIALADKVRLLRNHGQTALYRHETLGWNWRLTEMQAAIGRVQVLRLPAILKRKQANAATYPFYSAPQSSRACGSQWSERIAITYICCTLVTVDRRRNELLNRVTKVRYRSPSLFPSGTSPVDLRQALKESSPNYDEWREDPLYPLPCPHEHRMTLRKLRRQWKTRYSGHVCTGARHRCPADASTSERRRASKVKRVTARPQNYWSDNCCGDVTEASYYGFHWIGARWAHNISRARFVAAGVS